MQDWLPLELRVSLSLLLCHIQESLEFGEDIQVPGY